MGIKDIKSKRQEGFTIIEVMIVLVIAAVILLMVFLAVPALQRNSRNTQRKNDVANLLAAVNEYASNNNGQLPDSLDDFKDNVKLGFYNFDAIPAEVFWNDTPDVSGNKIADGVAGVYLLSSRACTDDNGGTLGTSRQFIAVFNIEASNGINQEQCQAG